MSGGVVESAGETAEVIVKATAGEGVVTFALFRRRLFVRLLRGVDGTAAGEKVVGVGRFLLVLFLIVFPAGVSDVVLNFAQGRRVLLERRAINKGTA